MHKQVCIAEFVATLDVKRPWTPEEPGKVAEQLVAEKDPAWAEALKERVIQGFYGRD